MFGFFLNNCPQVTNVQFVCFQLAPTGIRPGTPQVGSAVQDTTEDTADAGDAGFSRAETSASTSSSYATATRGQTSSVTRSTRQDEQLLGSLEKSNAHLMLMQQQLLDRLKPTGDQERLGFLEWVRSTIITLNHDVWRQCQKEITNVMYRCIEENDKTRQSSSN